MCVLTRQIQSMPLAVIRVHKKGPDVNRTAIAVSKKLGALRLPSPGNHQEELQLANQESRQNGNVCGDNNKLDGTLTIICPSSLI